MGRERLRNAERATFGALELLEARMGDIPFGLFFALRAQEELVKSVVISVRLSPRLVSRLDALCQASLQRRADIVRFLIARARLDDLPQAWRDLSPEESELLQEIR